MATSSRRKSYQKAIIIGAGRSGTNILRDVLTQLPGVGTWPCDEINYIWRYGNKRCNTDELSPEMARESIKRYVRNAFDHIVLKHQMNFVIEKTCANSLRVGFVDQVVPDAKYVFIVRDGRDVVASAMKRWTASLEIHYILSKARFVPLKDIPYYGLKYFLNHAVRFINKEKRLATWGPRFRGMQEMVNTHSLAEVCATQWRCCVERSEQDFQKINSRRVYSIKYEDFVQNPIALVEDLANFLNIKSCSEEIKPLVKNVFPSSVGKWQSDLSLQDIESISPIITPILHQYGYK